MGFIVAGYESLLIQFQIPHLTHLEVATIQSSVNVE